MRAVLELRGVGRSFGRTRVLEGIDLQVQSGERLGLIGPNGAGKSTLFNLISGRTRADSGQVMLFERDITRWLPHRIHGLGLARSFQVTNLFARLSVFDNLRVAALRSHPRPYAFWRSLDRHSVVNRQAREMMVLIGLSARRDVPAAALTYAEQRALELGVTLVADPRVILLDEPTSGMSRSEALAMTVLIRTLTLGRTLLLVEHDMSVVFSLADRIAVLAQGQLLAVDTPAAIRQHPGVRAAYLGESVA